jgi:sugar phosphate isomerase/epimerase
MLQTPGLSIQLYSARKFLPLEDQLAIIARNGYAHVETFGPLHDEPAGSARLFAAHGLSALSAHIPLEVLTEDPARALDIAQALGAHFAIAPYLPQEARPNDAGGWRRVGERLERAAEFCAPHGVTVAWHNHDFEFRPLPDGSLPITHLLGDSLNWEADLAWIARAGADPASWVRHFHGRIAAVHVKDIAPEGERADEDGWADVGAGVLPWGDLWALSVGAGAKLFVAEHDNPKSFERFARVSAEALRGFATGGK